MDVAPEELSIDKDTVSRSKDINHHPPQKAPHQNKKP